MAKQNLTQGLVGAAGVAAIDPDHPEKAQKTAAMAAMAGQMLNLKYGRSDELEADSFGVQLIAQAGYDPRAMLGVMEVLQQASKGGSPPEFFSTHPNPENRIGHIKEAIKKRFPNGLPEGLEK
jgi:predicted Zn-dependent protease